MLTRDQLHEMMLMRSRENSLFSTLPNEVLQHIAATNNFLAEINEALRLAASSTHEDLLKLSGMVYANPRLLLQAGNVITRGGVKVMRTTLYEFFLGAGDLCGAVQIEFGFCKIPNGEAERLRQYNRYKPHIDALAKQIELKIPAYDLIPLFDVIKQSSLDDINEALNLNDLNLLSMRNTPLRKALATFRKAVASKVKMVGMHYDHYTTLQQAFDLLNDNKIFNELIENNYYDKFYLIWRQVIGYLQRNLPAIDRFNFARAFEDYDRTLQCRRDSRYSFPDCMDEFDMKGLGATMAIFGIIAVGHLAGEFYFFEEAMKFGRGWLFQYNRQKMFDLQNLQKIYSDQTDSSPPRPSGA